MLILFIEYVIQGNVICLERLPINGFQSVVPGSAAAPAAAAAFENWLEKLIFKPHLGPTKSKILEMGPAFHVFTSPLGESDVTKVAEAM